MTEYNKPSYTVNPAVLKSIPAPPPPDTEIREALLKCVSLLHQAIHVLSQTKPYPETITVGYAEWDMQCNVLGAIREKYKEWQEADTFEVGDTAIFEIGKLLEKAGY